MKTTPNFGLRKPESNDFYDVDDFNHNIDVIDSTLIKTIMYQCNGVDDDAQIESIINKYVATQNQALTMKLIISGKFGASRLQGDTNPTSYNGNNVLLAIRIKSPGYSVKTLFLDFHDCDIPEYVHSQTSLLGYEDRNLKVYIEGLQIKSIAPPILLTSAPSGTNNYEPTTLDLFKCHIDSYYNCLGKDGRGTPPWKFKINCHNCFFTNSRNSNQRLLGVSYASTFRISNCSFVSTCSAIVFDGNPNNAKCIIQNCDFIVNGDTPIIRFGVLTTDTANLSISGCTFNAPTKIITHSVGTLHYYITGNYFSTNGLLIDGESSPITSKISANVYMPQFANWFEGA